MRRQAHKVRICAYIRVCAAFMQKRYAARARSKARRAYVRAKSVVSARQCARAHAFLAMQAIVNRHERYRRRMREITEDGGRMRQRAGTGSRQA